jgi:hypothetical protein
MEVGCYIEYDKNAKAHDDEYEQFHSVSILLYRSTKGDFYKSIEFTYTVKLSLVSFQGGTLLE